MPEISVPVTVSLQGTVTLTISIPDFPDRPDRPDPLPPFTSGVTVPDETNVGAGVVREYPTKIVNEVTTFSGEPDEPVVNTVFNDLVKITSDGWVFINCAFRGPDKWTEGGNLVWVDPDVQVVPVFRFCDINPRHEDPHWNGVGYRNYTLERCHVWGCVDSCAAFAESDAADPAVHVTITDSWLEKMSQFKPDLNRDVTHDDLLQAQGNEGPADDILIQGSRLDAYHSVEQSHPSPPEHTQISAIMLSPNTRDRVCITVRRSWLSGGVYTFNAGSSANALSTIVLTDNVWELPHKDTGGPTKAIVVDPLVTNGTYSGNVYTDGTPVPISMG